MNLNHYLDSRAVRPGVSGIVGVIVPHINERFFSDAIAGIEEVCFKNKHNIIICQSQESFEKECLAVSTLINQNVDCILISIAAETSSFNHLSDIKNSNIQLVQFDRCHEQLDGFMVYNDNLEASYKATMTLIEQGYTQIAFLGGPHQLNIFKNRKEGYLKALKEAKIKIPGHFVVENALTRDKAAAAAKELLSLTHPPDAFLTVSDHQSLGVLETANALGILVPQQLGIFGFANEVFSDLLSPTLSTIDQKSKALGKRAAEMYFESGSGNHSQGKQEIIKSEIIIRESSQRLHSK